VSTFIHPSLVGLFIQTSTSSGCLIRIIHRTCVTWRRLCTLACMVVCSHRTCYTAVRGDSHLLDICLDCSFLDFFLSFFPVRTCATWRGRRTRASCRGTRRAFGGRGTASPTSTPWQSRPRRERSSLERMMVAYACSVTRQWGMKCRASCFRGTLLPFRALCFHMTRGTCCQ